MKLMAVFSIPESKSVTDQLPIKDLLRKDFKSVSRVYIEFRKVVKTGRYGLAMTKSKNKGEDGHPLVIHDTRLLARKIYN